MRKYSSYPFLILDITNPRIPIKCYTLEWEYTSWCGEYPFVNIYVNNNIAYLNIDGTVALYDISDVYLPRFLSTLSDLKVWVAGEAKKIAVVNDYLFVLHETYKMFIFSIENPKEIKFIRKYYTTENIYIHQNYLYKLGIDSNLEQYYLRIYEVSSDSSLNELAIIELAYNYYNYYMPVHIGFIVLDNYLISCYLNNFYVFNNSKKNKPKLLAHEALLDYDYSYLHLISENLMFIPKKDYLENTTIDIINITNLYRPKKVCEYFPLLSDITQLFFHNQYLYLVDKNSLEIIDLREPANPTFIRSYNLENEIKNIKFSENIALILFFKFTSSANLTFCDISNPAEIIFLKQLTNVSCKFQIESNNLYLFYSDKIEVYNITNPTNVTKRNLINISGYFFHVNDNILYCNFWHSNYLNIYDISNCSNPILINQIKLKSYIFKKYYSKDLIWDHEFHIENNIIYNNYWYFDDDTYNFSIDITMYLINNPCQIVKSGYFKITGNNINSFDRYFNYLAYYSDCFNSHTINKGTISLNFKYGKEILFIQKDSDNDQLVDIFESKNNSDLLNPDSDNDGLLDGEEVIAYRSNPLETDSDGDGIDDYKEAKNYLTLPSLINSDDDGLTDPEEINTYPTLPYASDSDYDQLSDGEEVLIYNTDPREEDTDEDGLKDGEEIHYYKSDPLNPDSDHDGIRDGLEISKNHNPLRFDNWGLLFGVYLLPVYVVPVINALLLIRERQLRKALRKIFKKKNGNE
jgi:hypothetical protein